MTILERDKLNTNKLEVLTPKQAFENTMYDSDVYYDNQYAQIKARQTKLEEIIGALIETLSSKVFTTPELTQDTVLTERDIQNILSNPYITVGVAQDQ